MYASKIFLNESNIFKSLDNEDKNYKAVFEDDGDVGYLYLMKKDEYGEYKIFKSIHIYNSKYGFTDKDIKLEWTGNIITVYIQDKPVKRISI